MQKHPLKSRKFWVTIIALLISVLAYYLPPKNVEAIEKVAMMVVNVMCALGYIVTEGRIDKARAKSQNRKTDKADRAVTKET